MGQSTFSGPIRSLAGVYTQGPNSVLTITASTSLTVAAHAGRVLLVGGTLAADVTLTLPSIVVSATDAQKESTDPLSNIGARFTIFVPTTIATSSLKVGTDGTDKYIGYALNVDTDSSGAMVGYVPGASNDFINFNGSTTGGVAGSVIRVTAIASAKYLAEVIALGSGSVATPFADS